MAYYTKLGQLPAKRHVQFRRPDGALYSEEVFGTEGFVGPTSTLYHIHPPTQVHRLEDALLDEGRVRRDGRHADAPPADAPMAAQRRSRHRTRRPLRQRRRRDGRLRARRADEVPLQERPWATSASSSTTARARCARCSARSSSTRRTTSSSRRARSTGWSSTSRSPTSPSQQVRLSSRRPTARTSRRRRATSRRRPRSSSSTPRIASATCACPSCR